jgi:hypothetical protein
MASSDFSCRVPVDFDRRRIPVVPADVGRWRQEISLVPPPTLPAFRSLYAEEFFEAALPESSPLPWPSPFVERLGSPVSLAGYPHDAAGFP